MWMWVNETIIWAIAESMRGEEPRETKKKTFLLHVKQVYIKSFP